MGSEWVLVCEGCQALSACSECDNVCSQSLEAERIAHNSEAREKAEHSVFKDRIFNLLPCEVAHTHTPTSS